MSRVIADNRSLTVAAQNQRFRAGPRGHPVSKRYTTAGLLVLAALALAGCGRYASFTLPPPAGAPLEIRFEWHASPAPVVERGPAGEWDSSDVLNPSVIEWNGGLLNLYSGFDGQRWSTGIATSADGLRWTRAGKVLSPGEGEYIAANGSALAVDPEIFYWYQVGRLPRIALARSRDGRTFRVEPHEVLAPGPRGSWDERGVADPYVIRAGGWFYLFYLGQDRARRQRLGVARSSDGVRWTRLLENPVLELGAPRSFDENGLGEPAVWSAHGWWWMLYTGRDRQEARRLGLARSHDGVRWEKLAAPVIAGDQDWDRQVLCDATVLGGPDGGVRVWFGGGDVARPDERLDGQIGYAELKMVPVR